MQRWSMELVAFIWVFISFHTLSMVAGQRLLPDSSLSEVSKKYQNMWWLKKYMFMQWTSVFPWLTCHLSWPLSSTHQFIESLLVFHFKTIWHNYFYYHCELACLYHLSCFYMYLLFKKNIKIEWRKSKLPIKLRYLDKFNLPTSQGDIMWQWKFKISLFTVWSASLMFDS